MTIQYAIPYLADELPVNRLRIHGAADLLSIPTINNADPEQEAHQFSVSMTGYYSDPVEELAQRKDPAIRAAMTKITTQTCFAQTSRPLFKSILGSPRLTIGGSRFFIEGEYTFPFEPTRNRSCIEINHISFNSTNKSPATTVKTQRAAQDSARKREVRSPSPGNTVASSSRAPATPQQNTATAVHSSSVASSSRTPYAGSSVHATPSTGNTLDQGPRPGLNPEDFVEIDPSEDDNVTITPSQNKKGKRVTRANDDGAGIRRTKRQKKATAKAAALHPVIVHEAEEAGFSSLDDGGDGEE